jgi:hypothetical protein
VWKERIAIAGDFNETPDDVMAAFHGEIEPELS